MPHLCHAAILAIVMVARTTAQLNLELAETPLGTMQTIHW